MKRSITGKYLYVINYQFNEENLCKMEMKSLFNINIDEKYFYSDIEISPSRSPYIRHVLKILYHAESLDDLLEIIRLNKVAIDNFKFVRIRVKDGEPEYRAWIESASKVADTIKGAADMQNPEILLGLIKIDTNWIFGVYDKNDNKWMRHNEKPNSYTHSLTMVVSRALVNIAVGTHASCSLIDPCCGVGTVVLEALSMGVNVNAYELNTKIARQAEENLDFFGYKNVIKNVDMHEMNEHFDAAIMDIPYGFFTPYSKEEQVALIKTARKITSKLVLVSIVNMDEDLNLIGFTITDQCEINKGNFKRYITVCK